MRSPAAALLLVATSPSLALAAEEGGKTNLLSPNGGLMVWTVAIFLSLMFILSRFAFKPLLAAVEAREKALEEAIANAEASNAAAAKAMAEAQAALASSRADAQKLIADGRATAEKLKASMLEETKAQQQELIERARRELENEKVRAIAELRREAVDLAIAGASRVVERNLDDASNRKLVESFLSSLPAGSK